MSSSMSTCTWSFGSFENYVEDILDVIYNYNKLSCSYLYIQTLGTGLRKNSIFHEKKQGLDFLKKNNQITLDKLSL